MNGKFLIELDTLLSRDCADLYCKRANTQRNEIEVYGDLAAADAVVIYR